MCCINKRGLSSIHCVRACRAWTEAQVAAAARATVVVLYASAYGNTAALAQALSRGITKAGPCCFHLLNDFMLSRSSLHAIVC